MAGGSRSRELSAESFQAASDATLDGPFGNTEEPRHVAVGESPEIRENDGMPLDLGQPCNEFMQVGTFEQGESCRVGLLLVDPHQRALTGLSRLSRCTGAVASEYVHGAAVRLHEQETSERPPCRAVALRVLPQLEKEVLGQVLGAGLPAKAPGQTQNLSGVLGVRLPQRTLVASRNGIDERPVAPTLRSHRRSDGPTAPASGPTARTRYLSRVQLPGTSLTLNGVTRVRSNTYRNNTNERTRRRQT